MHLLTLPTLLPFLLLLLTAFQPTSAQLNKWAQAAGLKYFGTAVDNPSLGNAAYMTIARDPDEFGAITPANGQKWDVTEGSRGNFNYGNGDAIARITGETGQLLRCHTLVWHSQLPGWVSGSREQMEQIITAHIQNVGGHYKGQCYSWDVVNEAMEDDGTWRQSPMYRAMGTDFIPFSFKVAAEVDPAARLYYNDFNIERCCNAKINATLVMLEDAIAAGAPIHGIGMQGHSRVANSPSKQELMDTMAKFSELVEELAYSEIDIRHTALPVGMAEWEQQAQDYLEVVGACLDTPKCIGVTVWDFTDRYSWIPSQFPGEGEACLFDDNLNPKPAYDAIISLFQEVAASKTAEATISATTLSTIVAITTAA